jgi:hypothetical protein
MSDEQILQALETLTHSIDRSARSALRLSKSVQADAVALEKKVASLDRMFKVLAVALVLLFAGVCLGLYSTFKLRETSKDSAYSADLLLSCFTPDTTCSDRSAAAREETADTTRETVYVISVCQRRNPVADDPTGTRLRTCVNEYYPHLQLPPIPK